MKQQKSPHHNPLPPQKDAGQAPGVEIIKSLITSNENILKKMSSLEDLLKRKDDKPLTFKETCAYLGYAPSYLYKLTYKNIIPHHKPTGKMLYFFKDEIDEWIFRSSDKCRVMSDELKEEIISEKDPNQIEMELEDEVVIEFPLKSRRRK
jgi:excisionase family DNA binding protein